ncbi:hypothetical protein AAFF_G00300660 [Aldrovandia affinis]|uniref:Uncharacterized protein n=1 Tax=Aldrovandia affinis TaxID=143900 RepID=A0AAD7SQV6_9TELE|nr:hypothetical protein AAFF_G00300660 [Aldrovandia affinis]
MEGQVISHQSRCASPPYDASVNAVDPREIKTKSKLSRLTRQTVQKPPQVPGLYREPAVFRRTLGFFHPLFRAERQMGLYPVHDDAEAELARDCETSEKCPIVLSLKGFVSRDQELHFVPPATHGSSWEMSRRDRDRSTIRTGAPGGHTACRFP